MDGMFESSVSSGGAMNIYNVEQPSKGDEVNLFKPIRIVVVDDHELIRRGEVALLESHAGWQVVAEADNGEAGVKLVTEHRPDVAILDMAMPGTLDGLAATRELVKLAPATRIMILTMHASRDMVREVLKAGAHGYIMKSDASRDLVLGVETLLRGRHFFARSISDILLHGFLEARPIISAEQVLTKRELEIVKLLAVGSSNKEVATGLEISLRTAETHRSNIMSKLQLRCVQDLVRYAVKNNIVNL